MNETAPCKDCTDRHPACHGSCEKYRAWHDRYQAQQQHLEDNRFRWCIPLSAAREKSNKKYSKIGSGGRYKGGYQ
jgi:hypothetical protein